MNKIVKSTLALFLIGIMSSSVKVMAKTNISNENIITKNSSENNCKSDENFKQLIKKYPYLQGEQGVLVERNEQYIKYTPKEKVQVKEIYENSEEVKKDFDIKICNKDEYEAETNKPRRSKRSIGNANVQQSSWLKMDLQVYKLTNKFHRYMVVNACTWLKIPIFHQNDLIGVAVSDGLIIAPNFGGSYQYFDENDPEGLGIKDLKENCVNGRFGTVGQEVSAEFKLTRDPKPRYVSDIFHHIEMVAEVEFNDTRRHEGYIYGYYIHKQAGFSGVGIDFKGVPNISAGVDVDKVDGSIYISE